MYGSEFFPIANPDARETHGLLLQKLIGKATGSISSAAARTTVARLIEMTNVGVVEETAGTAKECMELMSSYVKAHDEEDQKGGALWPIVTRVRLFSRTFEVLKSGARLVDAPGLGDANKARNNMVLSYLNKAQVIWTCGDLNRILTDGAFYEMVGQAGKIQLLKSTRLTCIVTKFEAYFGNDYQAKKEELEGKVGRKFPSKVDFADELIKYVGVKLNEKIGSNVKVFVPSVSDYRVIAGLEAADGSTDQVRTTTVWPAEDVDKTQIPEMRLEVHTQALLARQRKSRKALSLVYTCMANIERMMASGALDTVPADVQAKAKTIVERFENELREKLEVHKAAFLTQMRDTFTQAIIPALETGCAFAASDSSIHRVIAHVKVALRTHWHPWRTLFANDGVHPGSNNFVSINSNQMLVDPILEQLTGNPDKGLDATWTPAFGDVKTAHLPNLEQLMKGELNTSPSYNERISVELKKVASACYCIHHSTANASKSRKLTLSACVG